MCYQSSLLSSGGRLELRAGVAVVITQVLTTDDVIGQDHWRQSLLMPQDETHHGTIYMECSDLIEMSKDPCRHVVGILNLNKEWVRKVQNSKYSNITYTT